jgi:hypothetical protein
MPSLRRSFVCSPRTASIHTRLTATAKAGFASWTWTFVSGEALSYTIRRMLMSGVAAAAAVGPGPSNNRRCERRRDAATAAGGDLKTAMELWDKL